MARSGLTVGLILIAGVGLARAEDPSNFQGEWRTTFGVVKVVQKGNEVTGTYGQTNQNKIIGKVDGKKLTYEFQEGQAKGDAQWTMADIGHSFEGTFQVRGGRRGSWSGWMPDPAAPQAKQASFAGTWLTSLGLMTLTQDGTKVKGTFALRGKSTIEGEVTGRALRFRYQAFGGGRAWFDLSTDGKTLMGAAVDDGSTSWFAWNGRSTPEYARDVPLEAGKILDGSTSNMLSYTVRAPDGYDPKSDKKWPTVVILHGSNMNGRDYVGTIASAFPDIARDFLLIGINGERPSNIGAPPQFNYHYVNFMGKSTYQGFPNTDLDSPALVAQSMAELKGVYPISKYLVGGHSQGGFLTYFLAMHYPETIAGAFPMSCGLVMQCDPAVFADETLKADQRKLPIVIIHGKTDPVVPPGQGEGAFHQFRDAGFPALRFLNPDRGGHMFALLPVPEAIRWLDTLSSDDPARLLDFAETRLKAGSDRDAIAGLLKARGLKLDAPQEARAKAVALKIDAKVKLKARDFETKIASGKPGWVDSFLAFRDDYQFADAAKDAMTAFDGLRAKQEAPAQKLYGEANGLFQQGKRDEGYKKYQEIVDQYPASTLYRTIKKTLAEKG